MTCGTKMSKMDMEKDKEEMYSKAESYWATVPATVDGMLGGFSHISSTDIKGSADFLQGIFSELNVGRERVVDCGAGIGRISKNLLIPLFSVVDMVELNQTFLDTAQRYLEVEERAKVGRYVCCGLQDFVPDEGSYDVVWCQWVLGHLTDDDLVKFLANCKRGLKSDGVMVIKENVTGTDLHFDEHDHSWTRSRAQFVAAFRKAELEIIKERRQRKFPRDIYEVRMFALR